MRGPPNLAHVVERFAFNVTRRRYAASTVNSNGLLEPGAITTETIQAHCYDVPAGDVLRGVEGYSWARTIEGTTTADVRIGNEDAGMRPDEIVFDGDTFEIVRVTEMHAGPTGARSYCIFSAVKVLREAEPEDGEAYVEPEEEP